MSAGVKFINRWVLSPMETLTHPDGTTTVQPVAAEYCVQKQPITPRILPDEHVLCLCEMTRYQYLAALKDTRLVVLDSMHSRRPVHADVVTHLGKHGAKPEHNTHDLLMALHGSLGDPGYLPEY